MKKLIAALGMVVLLISCMSLPAFAAENSNEYVTLGKFETLRQGTGVYTQVDATYDSSTGLLTETNTPTYQSAGFRATFIPHAYVRLPAYKYFDFFITLDSSATPDVLDSAEPYLSCCITDTEGDHYDLEASFTRDDESTNLYTCEFSGAVYGGTNVGISSIVFTSNIPSPAYGWYAYSITFNFYISTVYDPELERHAEIINVIDTSTKEVTQAIGDAADQIMNGWSPESDPNAGVDDFIGDYEDAENAATGGISDSVLQGGVDGAFDGDISGIDTGGVSSISTLFDDLLDALGPEFESLLVLVLMLGLAAVIIGRNYSTHGG